MKDRAAIIAWCSGAGALVILLLLIQSTVGRSPIPERRSSNLQSLEVQPVPLPPPPDVSPDAFQGQLERDLTDQKDLAEDLKKELQAQQDLTADLKSQLERQEQETDQVMEQLQAYQSSVQTMSEQQNQLINSIPRQNETQTMLLWGIFGLFMLLIVGGGAAFVIFSLWLMQIQRQQYRPTVVYQARIPPDPYGYYERRPLPPADSRQQYVQYDVRPFED